MFAHGYGYHGDFVSGTPPRHMRHGRAQSTTYEPAPVAPSYFVDPWQYGLRFLEPCDDGPPTVTQIMASRAGRGGSVDSEASSSSALSAAAVAGQARPQQHSAGVSLSPSSSPDSTSGLSDEHATAVKERRKLLKKLRQIAGLKQRAAEGGRLDSQQLAKLELEHQLRVALKERESALVSAGMTLSPGGPVDVIVGGTVPHLVI